MEGQGAFPDFFSALSSSLLQEPLMFDIPLDVGEGLVDLASVQSFLRRRGAEGLGRDSFIEDCKGLAKFFIAKGKITKEPNWEESFDRGYLNKALERICVQDWTIH